MANTTCQTLIEAAYARSTSNDPGKLVTDGEILGELDRVYQLFWAIKAMSNPAKHTIAANVLLSAGIGAIAQDLIDIRRVEGVGGGGNNTVTAGSKVNVVPLEEKDRAGWHLAPAVYRTGLNVTTLARAGDPGANETLRVFYLDAPAALAALGTQLDDRFDKRHQSLLVLQLAVYISSKDTERANDDFQKLVEERNMALELFLKQTGASTTALTSPLGGEIKQRLDSLYTTPSPNRAA